MRYYCLILFLALFATSLLTASVSAQAKPVSANEIRAIWIYSLIDWLKWPDPVKNSKITICTIGSDPVHSLLIKLKKDKYAHDIVRKGPKDSFSDCQLLYISISEQNHIADLLEKVNGDNTVTVSSIKNFATRGGMIEFVIQENSGIRINLDSARKAKIIIDSDLKSGAELIE